MILRLISTLIFLSFSLSISLANDKEELESTLLDYFNHIKNQEYLQSLDYVYPKLFENIPKEEMLVSLEQMNADSNLQVKMYNPEIQQINEIIEIDGVKYALIDYSFSMSMFFLNPKDQNLEEANNPMMFSYQMFVARHGEENVTLNEEQHSIDMNLIQKMFGIKDPNYQGWKFLQNEPGMKFFYETVLPQEIIDKM